MKTFLNLLCFVALIASSSRALRAATPAANATASAALIVTPDRGFLGNEEIRDACDAFAAGRPVEIVTVTDERTRATLDRAVQRLRATGVRKFIVLPLFLSASDPKWALARKYLGELPADSVSFGQLFGQSYLAAELLADRFRAIHDPAGRDVLVVGYGATDAESRRQLEADGQRVADLAAQGFGFKSVKAIVWPRRSPSQSVALVSEVKRTLTESAKAGDHVAVVPFALGSKLDSMMNFNASLRSQLPAGAELIDGDITPHPAVSTWMAREWNRGTPLRAADFGFVFLAHGADYHWNETMRDNIAPLTERYKIEFAFSMADQPTIERAVRRLEQRGARAITIVRVFGLAASFRPDVERMIGADVEHALASASVSAADAAAHRHGSHSTPPASAGHGHGGHHGPAAGPPPRIRSSAVLTTGGGMEDHRYFAQALLERAKALSKDPSGETVILVAHGAGDDPGNDHWRRLLASLTEQMRANGGANLSRQSSCPLKTTQ